MDLACIGEPDRCRGARRQPGREARRLGRAQAVETRGRAGGAGWDKGGRTISIGLRHVGSQYEDDLNQRLLRSATTVDAFAAWPVARRIDLVLRGENLLDETVVAGIGGDGAVERATPRTLWLGLRLNAGR